MSGLSQCLNDPMSQCLNDPNISQNGSSTTSQISVDLNHESLEIAHKISQPKFDLNSLKTPSSFRGLRLEHQSNELRIFPLKFPPFFSRPDHPEISFDIKLARFE